MVTSRTQETWTLKIHFPLIAISGLILSNLIACAPPVIVAGAAMSASVAADRRSTGTVFKDQAIEFKAMGALNGDSDIADNTHISVTSFNTIVLLTGQAPTRPLRDRVVGLIQQVEDVSKIHDEIEIAPPNTAKQQSEDTWTTARVKSALFGAEGLAADRIKVVTENKVVFLMGLVSREEGANAGHLTQQVEGISRIVTVFEYTD
jgi:osmotically-inducible protein OsmY